MYLGKKCPCLDHVAKAEAGQAMLPGLRSDLPARPPAPSSAVVRPSKFPIASFGPLPLRLRCPYVPRQPAFLPCPTSSSRPPIPCPIPHCCRRPFRPIPPRRTNSHPVPPVLVVYGKKEITQVRRRKEHSRKNNNDRIHTYCLFGFN